MSNTEKSAKRGRPVIEGSARQAKLANRQAKLANGETISRGRPSNPQSKRQARLAAQAARAAAGVELGGRRLMKTKKVAEVAA